MKRTFFVGGNWKMYGSKDLVKKIEELLRKNNVKDKDVEVVIFPPFFYIEKLSSLVSANIMVGGQNCAAEKLGAFTGEISAEMISENGGKYVIIGHSERRQIFKETSEQLSKKIVVAKEAKLGVIFCVGESIEVRKAGKHNEYLIRQLNEVKEAIDTVKDLDNFSKTFSIAYEPIWAIGTGATATPEIAQESIFTIRKWLKESYGDDYANEIRIIYGGSVNEENCKELAKKPDIDGFLVGGASLKAEFISIIDSYKEKN